MAIDINDRYYFQYGHEPITRYAVVYAVGLQISYEVFEIKTVGDQERMEYIGRGDTYADTFQQLIDNGYFSKTKI